MRTPLCRLAVTLVLAAVLLSASAHAAENALTKQGPRGQVIVVSNVARQAHQGLVSALRAKRLQWVAPSTDRESLPESDLPLAMVLFVLQSGRELNLHESWRPFLPLVLAEVARPSTAIASRSVTIRGQKLTCVCALLMAPTTRLLRATIEEARELESLPTSRPLVRQPMDLRSARTLAVLPSLVSDRFSPLGSAAESELTQAVLSLGAFRVVGRDRLPNDGDDFRYGPDDAREIARDLRVDAVAFVRLGQAESTCTEYTRYATTNKTAASSERMEEFRRWKAREEAAGRTVKKKGPEPDLIYAAPYTARRYTTRIAGELRVVAAQTGRPDLVLTLQDQGTEETSEQPAKDDYRWYSIDAIEDEDEREERTYSARLRTAAAVALVRRVMRKTPDFLRTRVMLPGDSGLGETAQDTPASLSGLVGEIVLVEGPDIFVSLGHRDHLVPGATLLVYPSSARVSGLHADERRGSVARLRVEAVFARTSQCRVLDATRPSAVIVGAEVEVE